MHDLLSQTTISKPRCPMVADIEHKAIDIGTNLTENHPMRVRRIAENAPLNTR